VIDCNEWTTENRQECTNMGKVKRLELWWQLNVTSQSERDVRNTRPLDFCWTECTNHAPKSRNSGKYPVVSHQIFTPRSSVLLEKLTGSQPVKIFPTIYGTRRSITAFTSTRSSPDNLWCLPYRLPKRETMSTDPLLIWRKADTVISHLQYDYSRLTYVQLRASVSKRSYTKIQIWRVCNLLIDGCCIQSLNFLYP
jgi:hypothetical protein